MASSEGSREIEAARLRLAAAKSRVSADTKALQTANESKKSVEEMVAKMLENATNSVNAAQNQLSISEKEVKEAQSMLSAAEKRWEVISIDLDSDNEEEKNTKQDNSKRRKVSLSPQASTTARSTSTSNDNNVHQIVVEGCGMPTVNGTYTRGRLYGDTPMYTKPEKESDSPLDTDRIGIIRSATLGGGYKWYIVFLSSGDTASSYFYVSEENANRMVPPENGWKTMGRGYGFRLAIGPAPTCRLLLQNGNSITGSSNVSGTSVAAGHPSNTNNGQLDYGVGLQTNGNNNRASYASSTTRDNSNSNTFTITNDTSASFPNVVDQINVYNCGQLETNGMYTRVGDLQGAPVYTKEGKEPNTLNCYAILRCRPAGGGQMKWYIGHWGAQADGNISFNFLYVSCTNEKFLFPPENAWHSLTGGLVSPITQLILPNDHIAIEGCGNVELNGTYSRNFRNTYEIEYKRKGQWNDQVVNFSIYQKVHKICSNYKWYVGRSINATSSSTIINQAMFRSRESNDLFPPSTGWEVIGTKRGGLYPGPTFRAVEIKQVTVEGCGLSKFNGHYKLRGDTHWYVKDGCDENPETHVIVRLGKAWRIGIPGDKSGCMYSAHVDGSDHPNIPPKIGWTEMVGRGKHPAPKLTWM